MALPWWFAGEEKIKKCNFFAWEAKFCTFCRMGNWGSESRPFCVNIFCLTLLVNPFGEHFCVDIRQKGKRLLRQIAGTVRQFHAVCYKGLEVDQMVLYPDADIWLYSMWRNCSSGTYPDSPTFGLSRYLDPFDDGLRDGAGIDLDTAGLDMVTFHVDSICRIIG